MTDFGDSSHEAIEATSNFDTDILRESYEKIKAENRLSGVEESIYFRTHPITSERVSFFEEKLNLRNKEF